MQYKNRKRVSMIGMAQSRQCIALRWVHLHRSAILAMVLSTLAACAGKTSETTSAEKNRPDAVGHAPGSATNLENSTVQPAETIEAAIASASTSAAPADEAVASDIHVVREPSAVASKRAEMFPGVYVDLAARTVEFEGIVPVDVNDATTPVVYLELVACTPDTKEHESLIMTRAAPSHVHAAMLLIGLTPGKPGGWEYADERLVPRNATGDPVEVTFQFIGADGETRLVRPQELIQSVGGKHRFGDAGDAGWVFAGSRIVTRQGREWYDADGAGMLIGLATFGAEVIAWSKTFSHESGMNEPEWIADRNLVPPPGTKVVVTVRPLP